MYGYKWPLADIHRRMAGGDGVMTYEMMYPSLAPGELIGEATADDLTPGGAGTFYQGEADSDMPRHFYYHRWWEQSAKFL